jgi:hypothetical protein
LGGLDTADGRWYETQLGDLPTIPASTHDVYLEFRHVAAPTVRTLRR